MKLKRSTADSLAVSKDEACRLLSISVDTLEKLIKQKHIKTFRLSRRVLIPRTELERVLRGE